MAALPPVATDPVSLLRFLQAVKRAIEAEPATKKSVLTQLTKANTNSTVAQSNEYVSYGRLDAALRQFVDSGPVMKQDISTLQSTTSTHATQIADSQALFAAFKQQVSADSETFSLDNETLAEVLLDTTYRSLINAIDIQKLLAAP